MVSPLGYLSLGSRDVTPPGELTAGCIPLESFEAVTIGKGAGEKALPFPGRQWRKRSISCT
jgi:hypothetical protein